MATKTILALTPGHPGQLEALDKDYTILRLWKERDAEQAIKENASNIVALTTYLAPVRANLMDALPNLEIIAGGAVGFDHIDIQAAQDRQIIVTNTPDVLTDDTADLGITLMLTLMRRVVEGDAFIRAGLWTKTGFPLGHSLRGKTLGIVGMGAIGSALAERANAFGMHIVYYGPRKKDVPYPYFDDLASMAAKCDVLALTCPGGQGTKHLIDYNVLGHLGQKGYLINIARGSVVKQDDLLVALSNKIIAGAALDVYENEPNVPDAFFVMDNVVLTPHIGSATYETRTRMGAMVVENIRACLNGKAVPNPVTLEHIN
ncbi:MAG: hydroxyacid dehydrogenase [Micavibrio sp.]|nr:hydroxyacid dehydrogenase [Micavibrio sp.]|tara:strand:+ start:3259 stop:4209 length:951 start_codon:yes stop_codon:yes gene_type:complete